MTDRSRRRRAAARVAEELTTLGCAAVLGFATYAWQRRRATTHEADALVAAERALAETGERYRSLFDYHPHAVFSLTLDGRFEAANPASERLAGHTVAELQEMTFPEVLVAEDLEPASVAFLKVLQREPQVLEVGVRHRDGRVVDVTVTAVPIVVGGEVVGVYGIAEDITARNRLQRDLESATRAAEQANQAKSVFLANMSHEIRTPLTSVLAACELLADSGLDTQQERLTDIMGRSGARLLRLVDDVLDFSRVEAGLATVDRTDFDPRTLIEDVVAPAREAAADKGLTFGCLVDEGLPKRLHGDADRIAQVLSNLLDNAVKFTEDGFVRVSARAEPTDGRQVDLRLLVADSGIGMTTDDTERVFETFRQADPSITRKYGGTGLGLAITKQLVELMDGSVDVTSIPGGGTTFAVHLPLAVAG
ncbi:sensor histidine kinase [Nocardioides sp.]|uniref:sensor histidine kinase n=1 Tax=Nocardioides sp. TaxID=35761 RepID=UPI002ED8E9D5